MITSLVLMRISIPANPQEAIGWAPESWDSVTLALNLVPFAGIDRVGFSIAGPGRPPIAGSTVQGSGCRGSRSRKGGLVLSRHLHEEADREGLMRSIYP